MDLQVLITAGVGIVTTFCSGFFAFLFSKKKYNAEVDSKQIANIKSTLDIYQNMVKDLGDRIDYYSKMMDKNKSDVIKLKNIVVKMVGKICTLMSCQNRCAYNDKELADLFKTLDLDIDEIDSKKNCIKK